MIALRWGLLNIWTAVCTVQFLMLWVTELHSKPHRICAILILRAQANDFESKLIHLSFNLMGICHDIILAVLSQ